MWYVNKVLYLILYTLFYALFFLKEFRSQGQKFSMCLHTCENILLILWLPANTFFHNKALSVFIGKTVLSLLKVLLIKCLRGREHKYDESLPTCTALCQSLEKSSNFKTWTKPYRTNFYLVIIRTRKMYSYSFW